MIKRYDEYTRTECETGELIKIVDLMDIVNSIKMGCPKDTDHSSLDLVLYEMFEKKD